MLASSSVCTTLYVLTVTLSSCLPLFTLFPCFPLPNSISTSTITWTVAPNLSHSLLDFSVSNVPLAYLFSYPHPVEIVTGQTLATHTPPFQLPLSPGWAQYFQVQYKRTDQEGGEPLSVQLCHIRHVHPSLPMSRHFDTPICLSHSR